MAVHRAKAIYQQGGLFIPLSDDKLFENKEVLIDYQIISDRQDEILNDSSLLHQILSERLEKENKILLNSPISDKELDAFSKRHNLDDIKLFDDEK